MRSTSWRESPSARTASTAGCSLATAVSCGVDGARLGRDQRIGRVPRGTGGELGRGRGAPTDPGDPASDLIGSVPSIGRVARETEEPGGIGVSYHQGGL